MVHNQIGRKRCNDVVVTTAPKTLADSHKKNHILSFIRSMALSSHGDAQYVYETVKLQPEEEYRIYLKPEEWIRLWMVHGTAEAFGTELRAAKRNEKYGQSGYSQRSRHHSRKNKHKSKMSIDEIESNPLEKEEVYKLSDSYLFSNTNVSIYTFNGSTLYIKYERGHCEHKFSTKEVRTSLD